MAKLALSNIKKSFGNVDVIHGIDLNIEDQEFVVFVGPSGCGKSTLLRLIAGLDEVTSGKISIGDTDVTELEPSERGVAMVFQSYALYPHMNVYDNMAFGLKMNKMPKDEIDARVQKAAKILELNDLLDRKPKALSGGQRQRVAIGRAIVREPKVFLLDEPLSNLDAELRVQMRIEIAKLHSNLNSTMIYVTHDQTEAMTLADKIVVLRAGRIEQVGSPIELYDNPNNQFVAGFIGSPRMNFIDGVVQSNKGRIATVTLEILNKIRLNIEVRGTVPNKGTKVLVGIRPEHFLHGGNSKNLLKGNVTFVEQLGGVSYLYVDDHGIRLTIESPGHASVRAGEAAEVGVDTSRAMLFSENGLRI